MSRGLRVRMRERIQSPQFMTPKEKNYDENSTNTIEQKKKNEKKQKEIKVLRDVACRRRGRLCFSCKRKPMEMQAFKVDTCIVI